MTSARSGVVYLLGDHGVLIITDTEPDAFDAVDRRFLELLGQTLRAALDRVERESVLRERNRRLARLHETGRKLMQAESPTAVADRVVADSDAILRFPITAVRLYDADADELVPVATTDKIEELLGTRPSFGSESGSLNWAAYADDEQALYDDIADMLSLARAGTAVGELEPLSLPTLVERSWENVDSGAARLRVETTRTVRADETRIRQLLENLLRNSVEHGSTGSRTESRDGRGRDAEEADTDATVVVGDLADGFYVEDDGPGIAPHDRETVFETGHSSKATGSGWGSTS